MTVPTEIEAYIKDASGNILSTLKRSNQTSGSSLLSTLIATEQPIYGSSRLGVHINGAVKANNMPYALVNAYTPPSCSRFVALQSLYI